MDVERLMIRITSIQDSIRACEAEMWNLTRTSKFPDPRERHLILLNVANQMKRAGDAMGRLNDTMFEQSESVPSASELWDDLRERVEKLEGAFTFPKQSIQLVDDGDGNLYLKEGEISEI